MPTINEYKKAALNAAGYSGSISDAEYKWLRDICYPYTGSIPDMWKYALSVSGYTGPLPVAQAAMLKDLGYTDLSISNKWYKYWRDTPLDGIGWWLSRSELDLDFANDRAFNRSTWFNGSPNSLLTYTSPSPKLVYGDDGVLGYAPHNLLAYSEAVSNDAYWGNTLGGTGVTPVVTADAGGDPTGSATADRIQLSLGGGTTTADISRRRQNYTAAALQHTFSVYLRSYDGSSTYDMHLTDPAGSTRNIVVTGSWQRFEVSATAPGTGVSYSIGLRGGQTPANSNTADVLAWGAQLNRGSSALTYTPTTSAAKYSLPIDHDPITFDPLGVLIEEQRTNLLTYAEQFDNAAWTKSRVTVTANATTAPDGTTTADKLVPTAVLGTHRIYQTGITHGVLRTYSYTCYFKAGEYTFGKLSLTDATEADQATCQFDLANGTVYGTPTASGTFSVASGSVVDAGNGWYRCTLIATCDATEATVAAWVASGDTGGGFSFTGDGTSGIYVWGAQLEAGASPTSYIPTVASQVTRAADQVSILTSAFGFSAVEGTLLVDAQPTQVSASAYPASLDDGTANEAISIRIVSSRWRLYVLDGGVAQANIDAGSAQAGVMVAAAAAWAANDFAISRNGASTLTDGSGTLPTVTKLNVGRISGGDVLNGHIGRLTVWNTRKTNAELQELTS